jgi:hypothetical protein
MRSTGSCRIRNGCETPKSAPQRRIQAERPETGHYSDFFCTVCARAWAFRFQYVPLCFRTWAQ